MGLPEALHRHGQRIGEGPVEIALLCGRGAGMGGHRVRDADGGASVKFRRPFPPPPKSPPPPPPPRLRRP